MEDHQLKALIEKYLREEATPEEEQQLMKWYSESGTSMIDIPMKDEQELHGIRERIHTNIMAHAQQSGNESHLSIRQIWWQVAAVLLLIIGASYWYLSRPSQKSQQITTQQASPDIAPGRQGAILTLADGKQLVLDSLTDGWGATQQGVQLTMNNGQLEYDPEANTLGDIAYNTINTGKGRKFSIRLPDNTRVWLNAASSLRYPTVFAGKERSVEITGEAYFEVAPMVDRSTGIKIPFKVLINGEAEVEVLGTHFNINAYNDESYITTTLLEGAVRTKWTAVAGKDVILRPGQLSRIPAKGASDNKQTSIVVENADVEQAVAWKNGYLQFNRADLRTVMRQLARWYDVEVLYEGEVPDDLFIGKLPANAPISQILKALEEIQVRFRIEGNKIIVAPSMKTTH